MAARSWLTSVCTALGVAAGASAAQLGVGYGLNVVTWAPATDEGTARTLWLASLAWVAWLAANSTVIGALCSDRLTGRGQGEDSSQVIDVVWRLVIALAAATGALISVPLVAVPARLAPQVNNATPQFTAGGYAIAGIIVGVLIAVGALHSRAIATNVISSAGWLWALAIAAVAYGLRESSAPGMAQLATWKFSGGLRLRGMVNLPSALLMLSAALLIGFLAAWQAGRRGHHRLGVAISGATGPLLVTVAYFLALPGLDGSLQQLSAAVIAPYAVISGLAGSVLVSAIGPKGGRAKARAEREARDEESFDEWQRAISAGDPASVDGASEVTPGDTAPSSGKKRAASKISRRFGRSATSKGDEVTGAVPVGDATGQGDERRTLRLSGAGSRRRAAKDELEDDAYAPSRAYVSDEATGEEAPTAPTGRAKAPEPLWPEDARQAGQSGGKIGKQRKRR